MHPIGCIMINYFWPGHPEGLPTKRRSSQEGHWKMNGCKAGEAMSTGSSYHMPGWHLSYCIMEISTLYHISFHYDDMWYHLGAPFHSTPGELSPWVFVAEPIIFTVVGQNTYGIVYKPSNKRNVPANEWHPWMPSRKKIPVNLLDLLCAVP